MQLLDIPATCDDMTVSLSMTGVTILTQSRYKKRHDGLQDLVQIPGKGFIPAKSEKQHKKRSTLKRRPSNKSLTNPLKDSKLPKKESQYRIDKKQVCHRIKGYLNQMKGEKMLFFWTITFPESTTDDAAYILLNKWLTRLRQERMLKDYLWVTERQKNGTIHFHMTVNQKMNVHTANKYMRASIMHSINKGEVDWSREAAMKYNGIDIAKDRKTKRATNFAKQKKEKALSNYLTKYITKNDQSFSHLAWHSSRGYSNIITAVRFTYSEYQRGNCELLLDNDNQLTCEYFTFRRWKGSPPKDLLHYLANINSSIQNHLLCQ